MPKTKKKALINKVSSTLLRAEMAQREEERTTLSFYRYVKIQDPHSLRNALYSEWSDLGVCGRIYLAEEGVNAQLSLPTANLEAFRKNLDARAEFKDMPFKIAVEQGLSFYKLTIKVKQLIVADGLPAGSYDTSNVGNHLTPEEFNAALSKEDVVVVDVRNHYESRIGRFEGALAPDADTFREELPMIKEMLKGKENKKVLLYCTGGIRCEKASSYLKHEGFKDVNQLYGGIINYAHEVKEKGLESKFKGRNFVFDDRLAERITSDVLTECDQCSVLADTYTNCLSELCNLLFIQCESCREKFKGCCSEKCMQERALPLEQKREKARELKKSYSQYISRLRPRLK